MAKVMVFGTFDILHPGHMNFFNQAKQHGEELIIVVGRDRNVEKIKGKPAFHNEIDRARNLEQFDRSNRVILGDIDDPYKVIKDNKPDVICIGYDQDSFTENLQEKLDEFELKTKVVKLEPYKEKVYKSSLLTERAY